MNNTTYEIGRAFFDVYCADHFDHILDVGSLSVNGTLRDFCPAGAEYIRVDLEPGAEVEIVLQDAVSLPFDDESFDIVLSTLSFRGGPMFGLTFASMSRVLKPGGFIFINVSSNRPYRSETGLALESWGVKQGLGLTLTEMFTVRKGQGASYDCVMVFMKGHGIYPKPSVFLADQFPDALNRWRGIEDTLGNLSKTSEEEMNLALSKTIDDLSKELAALRSSRSWRITAPLRAASDSVRRLIRWIYGKTKMRTLRN